MVYTSKIFVMRNRFRGGFFMDERQEMTRFSAGRTDNVSDNARNNLLALIGYCIYTAVIFGCYLMEVIKGSRTIGYFAIIAVLTLLPLAAMYIIYRRDNEDYNIRFVLTYGYLPSYLFAIFTTKSLLPFTYGVVIAILVMVFADERLCKSYVSILVIVNIANVIYMGLLGDITKEMLPDVEIRIGFVLIYAVYMILATSAMKKNNNAKMEHIASEKDVATKMLDDIMEISENMIGDVIVVSEKMGVLSEAVAKTKVSMEEVTNGTVDTAESVQNQLSMTEEIQNVIEQVADVSGVIDEDMEAATMEVSLGKSKIDDLIGQVHVSNEASGKVSEELSRLTSYASKMQSIVELIDGITSQTSLLALNASIEAARVGEAGKGFAVVASEISTLAEQTQNATVEITDMIENISIELDKVVDVVNYLMDNNKLQGVVATETASSFETIAIRTEDIQKRTQELAELVAQLSTSNAAIVDSVQTISAATEEVTAHSNVTLECSEENSMIVEEVNDIVEELQMLAQRLQSMERQQY